MNQSVDFISISHTQFIWTLFFFSLPIRTLIHTTSAYLFFISDLQFFQIISCFWCQIFLLQKCVNHHFIDIKEFLVFRSQIFLWDILFACTSYSTCCNQYHWIPLSINSFICRQYIWFKYNFPKSINSLYIYWSHHAYTLCFIQKNAIFIVSTSIH